MKRTDVIYGEAREAKQKVTEQRRELDRTIERTNDLATNVTSVNDQARKTASELNRLDRIVHRLKWPAGVVAAATGSLESL